MTEQYGFKTCCDSVAIVCLSFSAVYFMFGDGKEAFTSSKWKHDMSLNTAKIKSNGKQGKIDDEFTKI